MSVKVGIDFGTSNSGVAVYDGQRVRLLPVDPKNVIPEVIKTVLYITRDYRTSIGQEAVENYYRDNVNRQRRYVKQWAGEIDVYGADMHYVRDIFVYVDELKPGRLLQYLKTALRKEGYEGTQIFERYYTVGDLAKTYLSLLKQRAEDVLGEPIEAVTLGRPVKFSEFPEQDHKAQETLRQAAHEAGFKEVDFEFEPIAAALDYEQSIREPQNVVIFDFGGGTLDIAVMRLGDPQQAQGLCQRRRGHRRQRLRPRHHREADAGAFRLWTRQASPRDHGDDPCHPRLDGAPRTGHAHQQKYSG